MTPPGLDKFQRKLGPRPSRLPPVIKRAELEPVHQPEHTTRWSRTQEASWIVLLCLAGAALYAVLSWIATTP